MKFKETNHFSGEIRNFATDRKEQNLKLDNSNHLEQSGFLDKVVKCLKSAFLPEGYPNSVSEDYMTYQVWDTVQAFASSISGSLATQAVLQGELFVFLGVGLKYA